MKPTSQLIALRTDFREGNINRLSIRRVYDRLEDLRECGVHFLTDTVREPYEGFVQRDYREACHPFLLFSDWNFKAHEVVVQKSFADPKRFFALGRKWDEGFDTGNPLLDYLEERVTDDEIVQLTTPLGADEKSGDVNVGLHMIRVSSKDGKLVYDAELEAHRIVKPKLFGGFQVTDFLLPSLRYSTNYPELEPVPPYGGPLSLASDNWLT